MNITVVGLGKIGLPLAVQFARKGHFVYGVDIIRKTVEKVNQGKEPFPGESQLAEYLVEVVSNGKLKASNNLQECVADSDVVVVAVPLIVDNDSRPDFGSIDSVTRDIAHSIAKNALVVYETTLPVGTTRERFTVLLEKVSNLKVGRDFNVAFSPERVLTGRIFSDLRKYPKIVGGITKDCAQRGVRFYEEVLDFDVRSDLTRPNGVWNVDSTEAAEFIKLAETTYRDVNIALANQFSKYASKLEIDFQDVIEAANSQPYSHLHNPGIAVGGHCIPVYPHFYLQNDPNASIVREARRVNLDMPKYALERLKNACGDFVGRTVLIMGLTYRAGVKETAFSGAFEIAALLEGMGAKVYAYDSILNSSEITELKLRTVSNFQDIEIAVIQNDDPRFIELFKEETSWPSLRYILDGRNLFRNQVKLKSVEVISI